MKLLQNKQNVDDFMNAVARCTGEVSVISCDGRETLNCKSMLSRYIAIGRLAQDDGDEYEIFCRNKEDESLMLEFFSGLRRTPAMAG